MDHKLLTDIYLFSFQALPLLVAAVGLLHVALADYPKATKAPTQSAYVPAVKYAGPIVYSDEKPPIIHFPPPPKPTVSTRCLLLNHILLS